MAVQRARPVGLAPTMRSPQPLLKGLSGSPMTAIACFGRDEEAEPSYGSHGGREHPRRGGSGGRVRQVHTVGDARHSVDGRWSGRLAALSKLSRCSLCPGMARTYASALSVVPSARRAGPARFIEVTTGGIGLPPSCPLHLGGAIKQDGCRQPAGPFRGPRCCLARQPPHAPYQQAARFAERGHGTERASRGSAAFVRSRRNGGFC